jgi:hypothetical protein
MAELRSRTVAFRLTEAEGQTLDTLARGMRETPSEYARLAALDAAKIKAHALSAARAEVRRELAATRDALARIVEAYDALQRRAEALGQVELELRATRQRLASMTEACHMKDHTRLRNADLPLENARVGRRKRSLDRRCLDAGVRRWRQLPTFSKSRGPALDWGPVARRRLVPGAVVWAHVPFHEGRGWKLRPSWSYTWTTGK